MSMGHRIYWAASEAKFIKFINLEEMDGFQSNDYFENHPAFLQDCLPHSELTTFMIP